MRISLAHSTIYRYDVPVFLEPHVFRLRPRADASQRLLSYSLEIAPTPDGITQSLDQDGNVVTQAWFAGAASELVVRSAFEVETLRENPFDFILTASPLFSLPLVYSEPLASALALYSAPGDSEDVNQFALSIAEQNGWRTLDFLISLTGELYRRSTHIVRDEGLPLPPEETLRLRTGSCRDLSVLFCAACRRLGVPARFVSGYECWPGAVGDAHMHAWAEVYLDGGGWRGYDPSRGLAVSTNHVAVAAAADSRLAAPFTGTFRGKARAEMSFQISVQAGP
jgi:transglutaminase-like putative cysteine protease